MLGSFLANIGRQAVTVAVAWEIYTWTHSATALGLVGLVNVIPLLALSLPAGLLADRVDRRRIIGHAQWLTVVLSVALALLSVFHDRVPYWPWLRSANALLRHIALVFERHADPSTLRLDEPALPLMFLLVFVLACVRILAWPARAAIIPRLLPASAIGNAITWNSSAFEIATVVGPACAGFIVAWWGYRTVYLLDAVLGAIFCLLLRRVTYLREPEAPPPSRGWRGLLVGAEFIWRRKVILGASSLDLFATLLGGATMLLPVFADKILHVGAIGLGWLRAAPSLGAFAMALFLAHRAPMRRPGAAMLWAVAGFGAAIVVFGLSRWFWLSFIALLLTGVFDNVSVVVRQSLVQLLTPDALRGRVTGVNQIFIGSSNEIGALRAGLMGALIGPVWAVLVGGLCTVGVVAFVTRAVPPLRRLAPLHTLRPDES
jgi:MFS family permease